MKKLILLAVLMLAIPAQAETMRNLLTELDFYMADAGDLKASADEKIRLLNYAGREFGKSLVYVKIDTIIMAAGTDTYTMDSTAVGVLRQAYIKNGTERYFLQILDAQDVSQIEDPAGKGVQYVYVNPEGSLAVKDVPAAAETLIVSFYAFPRSIVDTTIEWDLPNAFEDAAVRVAASKGLLTVQTEWAFRARQQLYEWGWADLERLKNPSSETRQSGDTEGGSK